ncbi:erythromycin esterase family protein [Solibacillus sp. FSL K6-4121]|uniref:erythromycin esterase family protein n=1 Tax=Solibacillus sp. FSL K6-4121 TaxID=2921505 RepID=UPI0030F620F5
MTDKLIHSISEHSLPLNDTSLNKMVEAVGDAKIVMIGEASHGTSEFYTVRAELSKMLIEQKGFQLIAVEGDWPSAQAVNRYVKGYSEESTNAKEVLKNAFHRWPTWMWANEEVAAFTEWLKEINTKRLQKVGFYGIDMYSLFESIDEILNFLSDHPEHKVDLEHAKKAFSCFEPYNRSHEHYAISAVQFSDACIREVTGLLSSLRNHKDLYSSEHEEDLNVVMNALVAKNAESYYREMMSDEKSWNTRDYHMVEAIHELRKYYGEETKIIVWEHNTHIGDASETSMKDEQLINVGQIIREQYGKENTYAIGFGTYEGTVIAADRWGDPFEIIQVPPANIDKWEGQLHAASPEDKVLLFTDENRQLFNDWIGHRAIGVVYDPAYEAYGNYVPSRVGSRYDAFIFIDKTSALRPL